MTENGRTVNMRKELLHFESGRQIAISLALRFGALAMRQPVLELFPFYRAGGALQLAPPAVHATCKLSLIMRGCLVEM